MVKKLINHTNTLKFATSRTAKIVKCEVAQKKIYNM